MRGSVEVEMMSGDGAGSGGFAYGLRLRREADVGPAVARRHDAEVEPAQERRRVEDAGVLAARVGLGLGGQDAGVGHLVERPVDVGDGGVLFAVHLRDLLVERVGVGLLGLLGDEGQQVGGESAETQHGPFASFHFVHGKDLL